MQKYRNTALRRKHTKCYFLFTKDCITPVGRCCCSPTPQLIQNLLEAFDFPLKVIHIHNTFNHDFTKKYKLPFSGPLFDPPIPARKYYY